MAESANGAIDRPVRKLLVSSAGALNDHLARRPPRRHERHQIPGPLLVVGAPRSGTTFVTQMLTYALNVAYFSNLHHGMYGRPDLVERLFRFIPEGPPRFDSDLGFVRGVRGHSEAHRFWYRFFPSTPQHQRTMSAIAADRLRRDLDAVAVASDRPVVLKNNVNAVRLEPLLAALPDSRVLVVTRETESVVESILRARERVHGDEARWWSVEPPGIERLRTATPRQQVRGQVELILEEIDRVRSTDPDRFHEVSLGEMKLASNNAVSRIQRFWSAGTASPRTRRVGLHTPA